MKFLLITLIFPLVLSSLHRAKLKNQSEYSDVPITPSISSPAFTEISQSSEKSPRFVSNDLSPRYMLKNDMISPQISQKIYEKRPNFIQNNYPQSYGPKKMVGGAQNRPNIQFRRVEEFNDPSIETLLQNTEDDENLGSKVPRKKSINSYDRKAQVQTEDYNEQQSDLKPKLTKKQEIADSLEKETPIQKRKCDCDKARQCPPCAGSSQTTDDCNCATAPEMKCPSCNMGKAIRQIHEAAQREAKTIELNNDALIKESELQSKLFLQVKKYAQEIGILEQKARAAAVQLQLYTNKARIMKEKMLKAQKQAKQLALRTVKNAEVSDLAQLNQKTPSVIVNSKGGANYDINITGNEYNVLDDLDLELAGSTSPSGNSESNSPDSNSSDKTNSDSEKEKEDKNQSLSQET